MMQQDHLLSWKAIFSTLLRVKTQTHQHTTEFIVIFVALLHGLLYIYFIPPWQHYDEPTHFEYAWLIANRQHLPEIGEMDQIMRREVAASMLAHNFYWNLAKPNLLTDEGVIEIGISELVHPPAYYLLVSLPLRVVRYLDVTTQLYVARSVSLLLFVITITISLALMRDITPKDHMLRWAVPLALSLLPPFVDVMTAVNNDVGAVTSFSLFLWLSVRVIRYSITWYRVLLLGGSAMLAVTTKNTASVAVLLIPLVLLFSIASHRSWSWQRLFLSLCGIMVIFTTATMGWGDAAAWYRASSEQVKVVETREQLEAPVGRYVIQLEAPTPSATASLINPVLPSDVAELAGHSVTVGGWVWANSSKVSAFLSLEYSGAGQYNSTLSALPITVTTNPTFVAWNTTIPSNTKHLNYRLSVTQTSPEGQVRVYLDGAVLLEGLHAPSVVPTFIDPDAQQGVWAGKKFDNFIRNASGEQAGPRLRAWVEHTLITYARRSPTLVLSSFFDIERTAPILFFDVSPQILYSFFGSFAWGHVRIAPWPWHFVFLSIFGVTILGFCRWLWHITKVESKTYLPALGFLGLSGGVIWLNVVLRSLPLLDAANTYPVARYGFPAVLPALILVVGGWWNVLSRQRRQLGVIVLLVGFVVIAVVAVVTVYSFYEMLPKAI